MSSALKGKFRSQLDFETTLQSGYRLLPLQFNRINEDSCLLTNLVGEHLVVTNENLIKLLKKTLHYSHPLYNELKSKHFLIDSDSKVPGQLLALKYRTKFAPITNFTSLHMFVVTLRCEHSCPYCQVSRQSDDKQKFDMTEEVGRKAVDFAFKSPSSQIKFEFQGGEPLLNFPRIKDIVSYANQKNQSIGKTLEFVITTNLALINNEILDFCEQENIFISTSLDGPSDLHNANRPRPGGDSYQRAVSGIQYVKDRLGPDKVSALMTTTKKSLPRVKEIIDEYLSQGFDSIFLRPLSPYGFAVRTKSYESYSTEEWVDFYKQGLAYILDLNRRGYFFVEHYTSLILQKILTPFGSGYVDLQSPAGLGLSAIVFNYDGAIHASDESRMLAEMGDNTFKMGNLLTGCYEEIMSSEKFLNILDESLAQSSPMCSECAYLPFCGSDPVFHHATQRDLVGHKMLSSFCSKNMAIFSHIFELLHKSPQDREILMGWVRI